MNNRKLAKPKKNNSTTLAPIFGKKLLERTVRSESSNEAVCISSSVFGHNFGDVQVGTPSSNKHSCPLSLAGPTYCPFGGACHTCPVRMQAKLKIGQPGDKYEQEADRLAEQVMRMPVPQVPRKACSSCKGKEDDDKILQTKSAGIAGNISAQVDRLLIQSVLSSPGQPLDAGTRSFMEPRFGQDFSGVRVHIDRSAAESAKTLGARAYTIGSHVIFGPDQYHASNQEGYELIAHELVHVVQQGASVSVYSNERSVAANHDSIKSSVKNTANIRLTAPNGKPQFGLLSSIKCAYYLWKYGKIQDECRNEYNKACGDNMLSDKCFDFMNGAGYPSDAIMLCVGRKNPEAMKNLLKNCAKTVTGSYGNSKWTKNDADDSGQSSSNA